MPACCADFITIWLEAAVGLAHYLLQPVVSNKVQPTDEQSVVQQLVLQLARCEPLHNIYDTYLPKADKKCFVIGTVRLLSLSLGGSSYDRGQDMITSLPDAQRAWVVKVGAAQPCFHLC